MWRFLFICFRIEWYVMTSSNSLPVNTYFRCRHIHETGLLLLSIYTEPGRNSPFCSTTITSTHTLPVQSFTHVYLCDYWMQVGNQVSTSPDSGQWHLHSLRFIIELTILVFPVFIRMSLKYHLLSWQTVQDIHAPVCQALLPWHVYSSAPLIVSLHDGISRCQEKQMFTTFFTSLCGLIISIHSIKAEEHRMQEWLPWDTFYHPSYLIIIIPT